MGAKVCLLLGLLLVTVQGKPQRGGDEYYNEQEYADQYDYDEDEELPINDLDYSNTQISFVPTILSRPVTLDVDNGMTIRLPCLVDQLPDGVQIIWSKVDSHSTQIAIGKVIVAPEYMDRASVTVDGKGSTLHIGIAKSEDAGKYKCSVAVRGEQPALSHEVRIRAPPSVDVSTPSLLEVKKGDDVTLNCRASGKPKPTVKWSRVGKLMPDGSSHIQSEVVTFSQVNRQHAGTYRCTASNGHGREAAQTVRVEVEYSPELVVTEMFVNSRQGEEEVELVCNVHAHPAPTVTWEKGGVAVGGAGGRVKAVNNGHRHTLVIQRVQAEDFGQYSCRGSNTLGSQTKVIELSGLASSPVWNSEAAGRSENRFTLEWTSKSFSPITQFKLEVAEKGSSNWKSYSLQAIKTGAYHWAGKHHLSSLQGATQYQARVSAENGEGWSKAGQAWNFATLGAVPQPMTAGATTLATSSALLALAIPCLLLLGRM